ncbi:MAG: NADH:flavin oxidoreductase [Deltaproteobacteria bacterium]|jgi:2,4-dienoyl-CoA reductase-like NADH-dependent reductase (Old Yellow Enzyme family)|nr:NADH:flavin oxidoreductase [Deltaproteobacteria bacterium]
MATLFEETTINGMTLRNRLVRSATWEGMCEQDGRPTEKLTNCYRDLAQGGIGLIISGFAFVRPDGKQFPGKMGIHTDDFARAYENLTRTVHDAGGKIAVQLVHAGGQTDANNAGRQPLAPSAVKVDQFPEMPAELTKDEISEIIAAFAEGARRAKAWGFDGVQLHGAHGYLVNQFLSPLTNRRTDDYGGSIENRCRFLLEVYRKVRETVGADYPLFIKLNAADNLDGGLEVDDAVYAAKKLAEAGIDAIEVSAGTPASGDENPAREKILKPEKEAYNLPLARRIKEVVNCPVMVVGGFRSYEIAEKTVKEDGMDYIAMARPLIREPALADRWLQGDRSLAKCISCNSCFVPGLEEGGIYCVIEKKEREKAARDS